MTDYEIILLAEETQLHRQHREIFYKNKSLRERKEKQIDIQHITTDMLRVEETMKHLRRAK